MPFAAYLKDLRKQLGTDSAREHAYRPALKILLESLKNSVIATNDPRRVKCGAPDFIVTQDGLTVGYVETKDIGKDLNTEEKSDQLKRYLDALPNLVLTDYLEFRWYVDGTCRRSERIGTVGGDGKIKSTKDGVGAVESLLTDFLQESGPSIDTPKDLAVRMARFARMTRDLILATFEREEEKGGLHGQLEDFREALIPDLTPEQFADMYAQTIAYGLFAARCHQNGRGKFTREQAAFSLPKTNPFLRKLFNVIAGPDLDDRIAWMVDHLTQVLAQAQMADILKDFGKSTKQEDPVVHFYETFLAAYDPKMRKIRGVYYTPEPVVSYIVRSIDHLLKTRFNRPTGLADTNTLILDPAAGTATFLYMVVNLIREALIEKGQAGAWSAYVEKHLLPRIFGFELLMAPYAVAHLKMGLLLQETGYKFQSDQRLGIYLTNSLEEAFQKAEVLSFVGFISEEGNAAARIKKDEPIMVVLGNPPYSVSSLNRGAWITNLLGDYKKDLREKKLNIEDDFIKFIRFGQWRIEQTGKGILAFISNNTYLNGITHRRMRKCLMDTFTEIYFLDLHGNSKKKETCPDGSKDENVFDIQQGVTIGLFIKEPNNSSPATIHHSDLWGRRRAKYNTLLKTSVANTHWDTLTPVEPYFFFIPKGFAFEKEYKSGLSLTEAFEVYQNGLKTDRDELFFDFNKTQLENRIRTFYKKKYGEDFQKRYRIFASSSYDIEGRRDATVFDPSCIRLCLYRPFDERFLYYNADLTSRPAFKVMRHMLADKNVALITTRQTTEAFSALVTKSIAGHKTVAAYDINTVFPLYIYECQDGIQHELHVTGNRRPNIKKTVLIDVSTKIGLSLIDGPQGDLKRTFGAEDMFHYMYALLHSPTFRERYAEFLKIEYPRIPLTSDRKLFRTLVQKGAELVSLHLMESLALNDFITKFPIAASNEVEKVRYDEKQNRVYINKEQYFEGVSQGVWEFHVGGYQVCNKWLKDRKGRRLSYDDVTHYQKIVVALKRTIEVMAEIDEAIPEWPIR